MIILGFDVEDILRVVIGVTLGLLTIYRREMSCNRVFHEEEQILDNIDDKNNNNPSGESGDSIDENKIHDRKNKGRQPIRRRKSSSSIPSLVSPQNDGASEEGSYGNHQSEDPTEELLESAGLFLSGGPFLAVFIAVFDHLVACTYVYALLTFESARSLIGSFRKDDHNGRVNNIEQTIDTTTNARNKLQPNTEVTEKENQHVYNVAWNAATEYFSSISAKLDETSSSTTPTASKGNDIATSFTTRSKSTNNLTQYMSDEHSRRLLIEMIAMANRGSMDVTLLPSDATIGIFSYLAPRDVLSFASTSRSTMRMLDDGFSNTNTSSQNVNGSSNLDSALLIWKALFQRDFAWILSDWHIGREALLRSMTCYNSEAIQGYRNSHRGKVLEHILSIVMHPTDVWNEIETSTPFTRIINTPSSMKEFYFLFSEVWLNYSIAGCNTTEKCVIGLHGHCFDISNFVEDHPGSTETLLLQAGRDATVFFESIGHSRTARKIAMGMTAVVNGNCVNWHCADAPLHRDTSIQSPSLGLIRPNSKLLEGNKAIPGFLIPIKRSKPREQGGLYYIRQRLREEEEEELQKAQRWVNEHLGSDRLFGGVHVYYDPFCSSWRWWYTNVDFNPVFSESIVV